MDLLAEGPECHCDIAKDDAGLREGVVNHRVRLFGELPVAAGLGRDLQGQKQPRRGHGRIPPPAGDDGAEIACYKAPVVGDEQERQGDGILLAEHRRRRGCETDAQPPAGPAAERRPGEGSQCDQAEHAVERFDPLVDIGHRLRLQRVHGPEQGDAGGKRHGQPAEPLADAG